MDANIIVPVVVFAYVAVGAITLGFLRGLQVFADGEKEMFFFVIAAWPAAWVGLLMWAMFIAGRNIGKFFRG